MEKTIHHGQNIKRFRDMLGIKQEVLANRMGDDWSQFKISRLESQEEIKDDILGQVAKALEIPVEAIKNFDEKAAIVCIQSNHQGANAENGTIGNYLTYHNCNFHAIDKLVELIGKMIKEKDEIIAKLSERER